MQCESADCTCEATHVMRTRVKPEVRPQWRCEQHAEPYAIDLRTYPRRNPDNGFYAQKTKPSKSLTQKAE
jgi:hypothetical protein